MFSASIINYYYTPPKYRSQCFRRAFFYNNQMEFLNILSLFFLLLCIRISDAVTSSPPVWAGSPIFKAGGATFVWSTITTTNQSTVITYSAAMINSTLKKPCLGIANMTFNIISKTINLQISVTSYSTTSLTFTVYVNSNPVLTSLALRYLAVDNKFAPAFSMNMYTPSVNQNVTINAQSYVNFTASTGVTLNTSHENVLLPFLHYINLVSNDNTYDIHLNFSLVNQSFYTVIVSSTSNMSMTAVGFSRLIFDKTAIEAMGSDYFNYGTWTSLNSNFTTLSITIPPNIIDTNLFYGIHSFTLSIPTQIAFTSTFNTTSGYLGYTDASYTRMQFSYLHHKLRTCPAAYPYYNITQLLCYDQCDIRWYGDVTMMCQPCQYTCYTCTNSTACLTCNSTTDFRQISGATCAPINGYYDNATNSTTASSCTSPCATCVTSATKCLSCITGYYLSGNTCLACSNAMTNCLQCTNSTFCTLCSGGGSGATCVACVAGQYMDSSSNTCMACSAAITYCSSCNSNSTCTLCINTFTLDTPTNCSCVSGQYQNSTPACASCSVAISYCTACTSSSQCTTCMTTFTLASPTSCTCNSTSFIDTTPSCALCANYINYCSTCTSNSTCTTCMNNFTLSSPSSCSCTSGYYADGSTNSCLSCSTAINQCITCDNSTSCTSCNSGYSVNSTTGACDAQPCQISSCQTCNSSNYSICVSCVNGYSLSNNNQSCQIVCGDGMLNSPAEQCDDGNLINGDGCNSMCMIELHYSCFGQVISANIVSQCYYSDVINISLIWTEKIQGQNTIKFAFKLDQILPQWQSINFTSIVQIQAVDPITNFTTANSSTMISSYTVTYDSSSNRLYVVLDYSQYDIQNQYLMVSLHPYDSGTNPGFVLPPEITSPIIRNRIVVSPDNNQIANYYSDTYYNLYTISIYTTYGVAGAALLLLFISIVARVGKVIAVEMMLIFQLTYFSLSFLSWMNPIYAGLLPLRYVAGIVNFKTVDTYLEQTTASTELKGIYLYLNLSDNFLFVAMAIGGFIALGLTFLVVYYIFDWLCHSKDQDIELRNHQRCSYNLQKVAYHFLGEMAFTFVELSLGLFSLCLFNQIFYTNHSDSFSYLITGGLAAAYLAYFVALVRHEYPKNDREVCKMGEYVSQFSSTSTLFSTLKYHNIQMLIIILSSSLILLTIYGKYKYFSSLCIVFFAFVEMVVVIVCKPYKYGFVSCCKDQDNTSQQMWGKIELYANHEKDSSKKQTSIEQDKHTTIITHPTQLDENNSELFVQHVAQIKKTIKTKNQGLIIEGEVVNHTKLFLFNHNFRKIFNLISLILIQFIIICTKIYQDQITANFSNLNVKMLLPFFIQFALLFDVVYNYAFMALQILNKCRSAHTPSQIQNQPPEDSASQIFKINTVNNKKDNKKTSINFSVSPSIKSQNPKIVNFGKSIKNAKRAKDKSRVSFDPASEAKSKVLDPIRFNRNNRNGMQRKSNENDFE